MERRLGPSATTFGDRRTGGDRRVRAERRAGEDRRRALHGEGYWNSYRFLAATFAAQILGQGNPSREKPAEAGSAYEPVYSRLPLRPLFVDRSV